MRLINYSLKRSRSFLLEDVNIVFEESKINHLLGENGSGKSSFAKSLIGVLKYTGKIRDVSEPLIVLGSYTNLPLDLKRNDIISLSKIKSKNFKLFTKLMNILKIDEIPNIKIGKLSDGQKQKMKLLFFISMEPKTLILDEFTSSLDRKTIDEIYIFLNEYINLTEVTIVNITHNLEDLHALDGEYYLIRDHKIIKFEDQKKIIREYTGRCEIFD